MEHLEAALLAAWRKIKPKLQPLRPGSLRRGSASSTGQADELARRLARRRLAALTRPPRAWCLAVRAADTRINPATAPCVPEDAAYPRSHVSREHRRDHRYRKHSVTLDAPLLRRICAPVRIAWPGEPWNDVAKKLGVDYWGMRTARINGIVQTRHVAHFGGRRGKPVPILYTDQLPDPGSRGFVNCDPLWSWTAQYLTHRLPPGFRQTIRRVPLFCGLVAEHRYHEHAHPELDAGAGASYSRRLPPPPPDFVAYKWKHGVYVGDAHDQNTAGRRQAERDRRRRRHREHPPPSTSRGSLSFRGWKWICPACKRTCNTLYLPLPPLMLPLAQGQTPGMKVKLQALDIRKPPTRPGFACRRCHRVQFFSRASGDAWNQLITTLSGGLLYGREVPKPADFRPQRRRRPYRPMINRPSPKRQQVLKLLLAGLNRTEIAQTLHTRPQNVSNHLHKLYRQHGVHGRKELAAKLGNERGTSVAARVERRAAA